MHTFTPGWNDPPSLSHGSNQTASSTAVRNMLNKRVAFPMGGTSGDPSHQPAPLPCGPPSIPTAPIGMPLPPIAPVQPTDSIPPAIGPAFQPDSGPVSLPPVSVPATVAAEEPPVETVQSTNEEICSIFKTALDSCPNMPAPTKDNIAKRLEKLQAALGQSTLSVPCRQKLDTLVHAVKESRYTDAYNIHSAMMVEHFAEVNQWMVGVKALILECQKRPA